MPLPIREGTMICKRCQKEKGGDFYAKDSTCKECRKAKVRENRKAKADYYRKYDRERYHNDPRKKEAMERYQASEKGREKASQAKKRYQEKNPDKRAAHVILGNAVRDGRVIKPESCERCGTESARIHGHHHDYAKPLDVEWLCPQCHMEAHK